MGQTGKIHLFLYPMKIFIHLLLVFAISTSVIAQDYDFKINPRTGKFDMVRSLQFNGNRAVTRSGLPTVNAGGTNIIDWMNNYFFPSTNPGATLSIVGATQREFMANGVTLTVDLNWSILRPIACTPIQTITVDGVSQPCNPIDEGQSQGGTLTSRVLQRNVNTSYTLQVQSQDGKNGSASASVTWYWKRYWGTVASGIPPTNPSFAISNSQIIALSGSEFANDRLKSYNGINAAGNYLVFAFPSSWGTPTFIVNGLINTAFTKVRGDLFVNASGGSTLYQVWVSNTAQNGVIAQFQIQ